MTFPPSRENLLVAAIFVLVFIFVAALDVWQSSRYWTNLRDVSVTFGPFLVLTALALGAASVFIFGRRQ